MPQFCQMPVYASNHLDDGLGLYEMYWRNLPLHRTLTHIVGPSIAAVRTTPAVPVKRS